MKIKTLIIAVVMLTFVSMGAGSARAFGLGPASFGLGALGSAMGFAIGGNPRAAAIGGVAGFVAGTLLTPPYYYGAPAPPAAVYYPPPAPPVVYAAPPPPAPVDYVPPPPPPNRYYRPAPPRAWYGPRPY